MEEAKVVKNGFVDSWMVVIVDGEGVTKRVHRTGMTREASEAAAREFNDNRDRRDFL